MISPDLAPTWTNQDMIDGNAYTEQRYKLWLANRCVALWPQIFSWMVVNIYPADPTWDYRFDPEFANKAILVTFQWDNSGHGCHNASCYRTYPKGRMCTRNDPPTLFPSGEQTDVVACQPACYMKSRLRDLHQQLAKNESLIDKSDPARCVECQYLASNITDITRIRRLDGRYELYNWRDQSRRLEALGSQDIGTPVRLDHQQNLQTDTDMPFLMWDAEWHQCIIPNEPLFQQVVEPWWRDPSHSICRLTNFKHGNDPVWGYRPRYSGQTNPHDYSFLVKHSRTYCRAFAKQWDSESGSCEQTLLDKILSYTIAGDGLLRWVRRVVDGDWGCADDKWAPIEGERTREADPSQQPRSSHYRHWRADINQHFKLPPPNILLCHLGIDTRLTGNRLYWNSHEGVISQLALFTTVNTHHDDRMQRDKRQPALSVNENETNRPRYRNYNPYFYQQILQRSTDDRHHQSPASLPHHHANQNEPIDALLSTLEQQLQHKKNIVETRWQEKRDATYALVADNRDKTIDQQIKKALHTVQQALLKREQRATAPKKVTETLRDHNRSVPYEKNLQEYLTEQYLLCDLDENDLITPPALRHDDQTQPLIPRRSRRYTQDKQTITPATMDRHQGITELINHINDNKNRNKFWQVMQELGLGVSAAVGEVILNKALRLGYKKLLPLIARQSGGKISLALLKIGVRVSHARLAGAVTARLTTRALMAVGSFASGVGMVIGAMQLLSFVFDIASLSGWDPGHYNSETDLSVYRDLADFFNYAKESIARGPVTPFEMMSLLTTDNNAIADDHSGDQTAATTGQDLSMQHIDQRLSIPKWFNQNWPQCFTPHLDPRYTTISDDKKSWHLISLLDYLGSLTTNSYGQRIVDDPVTVRLHDDDLAALFIEKDYRDLTTMTVQHNVDNRQFNQRVASSHKSASILLIGSLGMLTIGTLAALRVHHSHPMMLSLIMVAMLIFLVMLILLSLSLTTLLIPMTGETNHDPSRVSSSTPFTLEQAIDTWRRLTVIIR